MPSTFLNKILAMFVPNEIMQDLWLQNSIEIEYADEKYKIKPLIITTSAVEDVAAVALVIGLSDSISLPPSSSTGATPPADSN